MSNKKRVLYVFLLLSTLMSCALPEQPMLTEAERKYFIALSSNCSCSVEREVNPNNVKNKLKNDTLNEGWYLLELDSLSCNILQNQDSLKKDSYYIAEDLHKDVLAKKFIYSYERIAIVYHCWTSENQGKSVSFDYKVVGKNVELFNRFENEK